MSVYNAVILFYDEKIPYQILLERVQNSTLAKSVEFGINGYCTYFGKREFFRELRYEYDIYLNCTSKEFGYNIYKYPEYIPELTKILLDMNIYVDSNDNVESITISSFDDAYALFFSGYLEVYIQIMKKLFFADRVTIEVE
ncbi:MAG: hypothetical protein C4K58_00365 [Flavobacteriaceae bacterium]|nr:MAG: hypothetical protein C4K58_00365 [Flavobacteriaceae bacterium]